MTTEDKQGLIALCVILGPVVILATLTAIWPDSDAGLWLGMYLFMGIVIPLMLGPL